MTATDRSPGGRLPLFDPARLTTAQKALFDTLSATWIRFADEKGVKATDGDRLIGPFNPFLLHPEITEKLSDLQVAEAAHTGLPKAAREAVILVTGAVWRADYELYAQVNVARETGLADPAVASLAQGEIPDGLAADVALAARVARTLLTEHRIDDELYHAAEQTFGNVGLYDLLMVVGVYQTVCSMLALFEIPAPE